MSVHEVCMSGEWGGPIERVYNNCGDENTLICHQPMLFEASQDSTTSDLVFQSNHRQVLLDEISKG